MSGTVKYRRNGSTLLGMSGTVKHRRNESILLEMSGTVKYRRIREVKWPLSPSGTVKYLGDLESEGFRWPKLREKKRKEKRKRRRGRRSKPLAPWVAPTEPQAGRTLPG